MNKGEPIANLPAYDDDNEAWRVIIETPKGSHNKYKFDASLGLFILNGVLPEGMGFPYDFGFLPSTVGDNGDPLDVLLLMDEPAFCGCLVPARLIGVIEAEQTERDGTSERNDRLVAIPIKGATLRTARASRISTRIGLTRSNSSSFPTTAFIPRSLKFSDFTGRQKPRPSPRLGKSNSPRRERRKIRIWKEGLSRRVVIS